MVSQKHLAIKKISVHLCDDESDVRLQAMRAVGNLCIDNGEHKYLLLRGGCLNIVKSSVNVVKL